MARYWAVDRFEAGGLAVLEGDDGAYLTLPRSWLPAATHEGSVLRVARGKDDGLRDDPTTLELRLTIDEQEEARRRAEAQELHDELPRGPEGDFEL